MIGWIIFGMILAFLAVLVIRALLFTPKHQAKPEAEPIEFDKDAIAAEGYDTITPVVVCNSDDFATFKTTVGKTVAEGDTVIELAK